MRKLLFILCLSLVTSFAYGQTKMSDLDFINPGDGRLYVEYIEGKIPVEGKIRIITGYTTQYIDAEFSKGFAVGKWEYYEDNKLSEVTNYANGYKNGALLRYHSDGKTVKEEANMKDGKADGITKTYSEDGKLVYEKGLKDGTDNGPERRYDENGKLTYEFFYKDGKKEGKAFYKMNIGKADAYTKTENYKNGKFDGEYSEKFENGQVRTKGKYIDGKKEGLWESFDKDGLRKGNSETFKNGKVIKRISYYTDGSVEMEKNFNDEGIIHGVEKKFAFDGGHLIAEKNYVNGKQVGKQMARMSSSKPYFEYSIYNTDGKKDGEYSEIFEDSKKTKTKGRYVNDKKHGKWLYGNDSGFYSEEIYDNGKLIEKKDLTK